MRLALALAATMLVALLSGCTTSTDTTSSTAATTSAVVGDSALPPAPQSASDCKSAPRLAAGLKVRSVIETNMGTIRLDLTPDLAPITVANMVCLARAHFYDGVKFHRIITDFMMQGGDPQGTGSGGPGYSIKDEFTPQLRFDKPGVLAMANAGPNTGGSQFFITFAPTPWLNDHHSIYGQATADSMAVVERVNKEASTQSGTPKVPVTMTKMTIEVTGSSGASAASTTAVVTTTAPQPDCPDSTNAPAGQSGAVQLDLVTPGSWTVCGDTEYIYAWVHNNGTAQVDYTWSITGKGGVALPAGWTVTFATPTGSLKPAGTKVGSGSATTYPDWAATLVTLQVPSAQPTGDLGGELHAAGATTAFTFHVVAPHGTVSGPGSQVDVDYDGKFANGTRFDQGSFPTTLGSGQTVPGFDNGLMGLGNGETATLVIPPPFAYGYDNPPGRYARFNGQSLYFTVGVTEQA